MSIRKLKCFFSSVTLGMIFCSYGNDSAGRAQQKLIVLKKGDTVYARSYFSPENDILIAINKGTNRQISFYHSGLMPSAAAMDEESIWKLKAFHGCGDDVTPWGLNGTNIGANHGCSDGHEISAGKHGLSTSDIGTEWLDEAGGKFYVIKVMDQDKFWILSENEGKDGIWKFKGKVKGKSLKNSSNGRILKFEEVKMAQIIPACRINEQKYLVNGTIPLEDGKVTPCEFLDIVEKYDIIAPDSLLASIQKNPGKEADFTAGNLDSVLAVHTNYRLLPLGACTVEHKVRANRKFNMWHALFVMTAPLEKTDYDIREEYVPKTLPFEKGGVRYDFKSVQDVSANPKEALVFGSNQKNIEDVKNLPDRFIQFLVKTENGKPVRKIGFAIGYSLIEGLSRPELRAKTVSEPLMIYTSSKTYPCAIDQRIGIVQAGAEFHCLVYRQYFNPSAHKNATNVYWHKEGDAYLLYADYHKAVDDDVIILPDYLSGKKITVVEKTPSLKLLTEDKIPANGLRLSVGKEAYGYIVLKLD